MSDETFKRVPLNEERAVLRERREATRALLAELRHTCADTPWMLELLNKLYALVLQGKSSRARDEVFEALEDGELIPDEHANEENEVFRGLLRLADALTEVQALEAVRALPTDLGREPPGVFLGISLEHSRALVELLLGTLDDALSPEDNLSLVIHHLAENLNHWYTAPSLFPGPETRELRDHYERLHVLAQGWVTALGIFTAHGGVTEGFLKLLRWRLERSEDVLTLPQAWRLPREMRVSPEIFGGLMSLLDALGQELFEGGDTTLSVDTWDALVEAVETLPEALGQGTAWRQRDRKRQAVEGRLDSLGEQGSSLAEDVRTLEKDLAETPREMRALLLRQLLLAHTQG